MQLVSQRRPDVVRVVIPRIVLREMDKMNHGQVPLHLKNQIRLALCMLEEEQNSAAGRPTIIHMQARLRCCCYLHSKTKNRDSKPYHQKVL